VNIEWNIRAAHLYLILAFYELTIVIYTASNFYRRIIHKWYDNDENLKEDIVYWYMINFYGGMIRDWFYTLVMLGVVFALLFLLRTFNLYEYRNNKFRIKIFVIVFIL